MDGNNNLFQESLLNSHWSPTPQATAKDILSQRNNSSLLFPHNKFDSFNWKSFDSGLSPYTPSIHHSEGNNSVFDYGMSTDLLRLPKDVEGEHSISNLKDSINMESDSELFYKLKQDSPQFKLTSSPESGIQETNKSMGLLSPEINGKYWENYVEDLISNSDAKSPSFKLSNPKLSAINSPSLTNSFQSGSNDQLVAQMAMVMANQKLKNMQLQQQVLSLLSSNSVSNDFDNSLQNDLILQCLKGNNFNPELMRRSSVNQHDIASILNSSSPKSLNEEISMLSIPYRGMIGPFEAEVEKEANMYRTSASCNNSNPAYTWTGKLPMKMHRSPEYSRKVFLGGVPWDSKEEDLINAFNRFGNVSVLWPQREGVQKLSSLSSSPKGYSYIIYERDESVVELMKHCSKDPNTNGDFYKVASPKFRSKDVQIIPWCVADSQWCKTGFSKPDAKRTVFIGALHGMITADGLAQIMNELFGNVVFAALDTDKYKYPIGSGRVAFNSQKSYMRAVTANFVDVRTAKFSKLIQIDPYLEDSICNMCNTWPGIYFCRSFDCFKYFCPPCWRVWHFKHESNHHKPLRRTLKTANDRR